MCSKNSLTKNNFRDLFNFGIIFFLALLVSGEHYSESKKLINIIGKKFYGNQRRQTFEKFPDTKNFVGHSTWKKFFIFNLFRNKQKIYTLTVKRKEIEQTKKEDTYQWTIF